MKITFHYFIFLTVTYCLITTLAESNFLKLFFDNRLNLFIGNKGKQILLCLSAHKYIKKIPRKVDVLKC